MSERRQARIGPLSLRRSRNRSTPLSRLPALLQGPASGVVLYRSAGRRESGATDPHAHRAARGRGRASAAEFGTPAGEFEHPRPSSSLGGRNRASVPKAAPAVPAAPIARARPANAAELMNGRRGGDGVSPYDSGLESERGAMRPALDRVTSGVPAVSGVETMSSMCTASVRKAASSGSRSSTSSLARAAAFCRWLIGSGAFANVLP